MVLESISIVLPDTNNEFFKHLITILGYFGDITGTDLRFTPSSPDYLPILGIKQGPVKIPQIEFDNKFVKIRNTTGIEKENTLAYTPITLIDLGEQLEPFELVKMDHIGFNLPYFDGVHPEVLELREELKDECIYHLFPTGEPWDFIIPGTLNEIYGSEVDYSKVRKPKFELVSFDGCSKPLIQFDFSIKTTYDEIVSMFPEGIKNDNLHNVWVYIENPYGIDICFVVNEPVEGDWSEFFSDSKLS